MVVGIAGVNGDEFDARRGVGYNAGYFLPFGGVHHRYYPEADIGGRAFDFNAM